MGSERLAQIIIEPLIFVFPFLLKIILRMRSYKNYVMSFRLVRNHSYPNHLQKKHFNRAGVPSKSFTKLSIKSNKIFETFLLFMCHYKYVKNNFQTSSILEILDVFEQKLVQFVAKYNCH